MGIMGRIKTFRDKYICERCSHEWFSRTTGDPMVCPQCKSSWWDILKKQKEEINCK
jgi:DNA-directed RNA polymerase subunit RPC12/RpoP